MGPRILNSYEESPNLSIREDSAGSLSAMEMLDRCNNGGGGQVEEDEGKKNKNNDGKKKRNKERFLWTESLHSKFVTAVDQLGGPERAIPSKIMSAMNVHRLTRLIVASHLQKYRIQLKNEKENQQACGCSPSSFNVNMDTTLGNQDYDLNHMQATTTTHFHPRELSLNEIIDCHEIMPPFPQVHLNTNEKSSSTDLLVQYATIKDTPTNSLLHIEDLIPPLEGNIFNCGYESFDKFPWENEEHSVEPTAIVLNNDEHFLIDIGATDMYLQPRCFPLDGSIDLNDFMHQGMLINRYPNENLSSTGCLDFDPAVNGMPSSTILQFEKSEPPLVEDAIGSQFDGLYEFL